MIAKRLLSRMIIPLALVVTLGLLYSTPSQANLDGDPSTLEIVLAGRDQTGGVPNCQTTAHTGHGGLDFINTATATQTTVLPASVTLPTLSLLYRVDGTVQPGDAFTVTAQSTSLAVSMSLPLDGADWTHAWLDVSDLAGQSISVTLESAIAPQSPPVHVIVDQVSLGTALPGVYHVMLLLILRQS